MKKEMERKITVLRKDTEFGYHHEAHFVRVGFSTGKDDCYLQEYVVWSNGHETHHSYTQFQSNEEGNNVYRDFRNNGYELATSYTLDGTTLESLESLVREA